MASGVLPGAAKGSVALRSRLNRLAEDAPPARSRTACRGVGGSASTSAECFARTTN